MKYIKEHEMEIINVEKQLIQDVTGVGAAHSNFEAFMSNSETDSKDLQ